MSILLKSAYMDNKIKSFTDLISWRIARDLVLKIYKITKEFPPAEIFGLSSQMRRASISISSNIAEGFGRRSKKEKIQFYSIAKGSLIELQNQLVLSLDIGYINKDEFKQLAELMIRCSKLITGLIHKTPQK
jgi:four helix bundle protein